MYVQMGKKEDLIKDFVFITGIGRNSEMPFEPVLRPAMQRMLMEDFEPPLPCETVEHNPGRMLVRSNDLLLWLNAQVRCLCFVFVSPRPHLSLTHASPPPPPLPPPTQTQSTKKALSPAELQSGTLKLRSAEQLGSSFASFKEGRRELEAFIEEANEVVADAAAVVEEEKTEGEGIV